MELLTRVKILVVVLRMRVWRKGSVSTSHRVRPPTATQWGPRKAICGSGWMGRTHATSCLLLDLPCVIVKHTRPQQVFGSIEGVERKLARGQHPGSSMVQGKNRYEGAKTVSFTRARKIREEKISLYVAKQKPFGNPQMDMPQQACIWEIILFIFASLNLLLGAFDLW